MKKSYLILIYLLLSSTIFSQGLFKVDTTIKTQNKIAWDTLKYRKYERVLIVGVFQQFRNFSNKFEQNINTDSAGISKIEYVAESKLIGGVTLSYDKFQISVATKTQPQQLSSGKGNTKTFNIGLNIGDNRWVYEGYFRKFTGFYNKNTINFDTTFKRTGNYLLQPNLKSTLFMNRFMYFTNHSNFSYKSGFGCNYRQLKSSATWILGGSFNVYNLTNDSTIFPTKAKSLYNDYSDFKGIRTINLAVNIGAAATFVVFKAFFINGYFTVGPEQQWRNYDLSNANRKLSYVSWSGTGRFSAGLNLKKFYFLFSIFNDYSFFGGSKSLVLTSTAFTQNVSFGWRFHKKTPKFYQKFMKTKIYNLF